MPRLIFRESFLSVVKSRSRIRNSKQSFTKLWGYWLCQQHKGRNLKHTGTLLMSKGGKKFKLYSLRKQAPCSTFLSHRWSKMLFRSEFRRLRQHSVTNNKFNHLKRRSQVRQKTPLLSLFHNRINQIHSRKREEVSQTSTRKFVTSSHNVRHVIHWCSNLGVNWSRLSKLKQTWNVKYQGRWWMTKTLRCGYPWKKERKRWRWRRATSSARVFLTPLKSKWWRPKTSLSSWMMQPAPRSKCSSAPSPEIWSRNRRLGKCIFADNK